MTLGHLEFIVARLSLACISQARWPTRPRSTLLKQFAINDLALGFLGLWTLPWLQFCRWIAAFFWRLSWLCEVVLTAGSLFLLRNQVDTVGSIANSPQSDWIGLDIAKSTGAIGLDASRVLHLLQLTCGYFQIIDILIGSVRRNQVVVSCCRWSLSTGYGLLVLARDICNNRVLVVGVWSVVSQVLLDSLHNVVHWLRSAG